MDKDRFFGMQIESTDEPFYFGNYPNRSIDDKGRLALPAGLAGSLANDLDHTERAVLLDLEDCFAIMGKESWLLYYNYLSSKRKKDDLVQFGKDTYENLVDKHKRIVVPKTIRDKTVGDSEPTVDVAGLGKCILVVNHDKGNQL